MVEVPNYGVILLAAGYGTRLARDLARAPELSYLANTPKPLLPISGRPLISHWLVQLQKCYTVIVTNSAHYPLYEAWKKSSTKDLVQDIEIISDGSTSNSDRLGAIRDIEIGIRAFEKRNIEFVVIIAGDTLLPGVDINSIINKFEAGEHGIASIGYRLQDLSDCKRRGMYRIEMDGSILVATELVEKPATPAEAPSDLACAPVYLVKKELWGTLRKFLDERVDVPVEMKDAPGFWLRDLLNSVKCRVFEVHERIDIGGLNHYKQALSDIAEGRRADGEPAVGRAYPRVGLLGNPSDGYGGKVISIALDSEGFAEVVATEHPKFVVERNEHHELDEEFDNIGKFVSSTEDLGLFYGARTLVRAAAVLFAKEYEAYLRNTNSSCNQHEWDQIPNCKLSYATSIPTRIGLSGSSAFILATFRALARFHSTSLMEINSDIHFWPKLMHKAEAELLGIACGLQDRVVQVMQGCVAMDFTGTVEREDEWNWIPEEGLPDLWLVYMEGGRVGECSGKVHSDLVARHSSGDEVLKNAVSGLKEVVDKGRRIIEECAEGRQSSCEEFSGLFKRNFELRLSMVGKGGIGRQNLEMVSTAQKAGFAAKMTGSGGCAVCVPEPVRKLTVAEVAEAEHHFRRSGMVFRKVKVLPRITWGKR